MANAYGDSYSAVQAATDQQAQERQAAGEASERALLAQQQLQMQRESQHLNFALANKRLDVDQQNADTQEQYRQDFIKWRQQQLSDQTQLQSKQIDANVTMHANELAAKQAMFPGFDHAAIQNRGQVIANNYQTSARELKNVSDQLSTVQQTAISGVAQNRLSYDAKTDTYMANVPAYSQLANQVNAQRALLQQHLNQTKGDMDTIRNEAGKAGFYIDHSDGSLVHLNGMKISPGGNGTDYDPSSPIWAAPAGGISAGSTSGTASPGAGSQGNWTPPVGVGGEGDTTSGTEDSGGVNHPLAAYASQIPGGLATADALKTQVDNGQITPQQASLAVMGKTPWTPPPPVQYSGLPDANNVSVGIP